MPDQRLPRIEVCGLSVWRGGTSILKDIHWRVEPGEHWVILGANGSGKTSLLSALTGYLTPSAGTISVLGREFGRADWRELRKEIGLVSSAIRQMMPEDEPALETVISGKFAMIDLWQSFTPQDRRRAFRLLKQVECAYLAERPWRFLSQGERQRVLIARALMAKPRLLILDEPCAGLDPVARETFLSFLNRLAQSPGTPTLVFVTHHVEEIEPVFSHVLILKQGMVATAAPKDAALTSKSLSQAFGTTLKVRRTNSRYTLRIPS